MPRIDHTGGLQTIEYRCPYCNETNEAVVEAAVCEVQSYVEDCVVCCRPIHLFISFDPIDETIGLDARREDD